MDLKVFENDKRILSSIKKIENILVQDEKMQAVSIQKRIYTILPVLTGGGLFPLFHRRQVLIATTGRLILMKRNLIMGYTVYDFRWQDISKVFLKVGIFGTDISVEFNGSGDLALSKNYSIVNNFIGFDKNLTENVYRIAEFQEQSWREKRRIRSLEELRAKSGGVHLGTNGIENNEINNISRLKEIKTLLEEGLISDSEYESLKAKIINNI